MGYVTWEHVFETIVNEQFSSSQRGLTFVNIEFDRKFTHHPNLVKLVEKELVVSYFMFGLLSPYVLWIQHRISLC